MPNPTDQLLHTWFRRLRESQFGHYEAARGLEACNLGLGLPAILLATLVGTSVFSALGRSVDSWAQILVGLLSVAAAMLSAVQTFLRFSERAEKHRAAAARYGAARRRIEEILAVGGEVSRQELAEIRQRIDQLAEEAPAISPRAWARIKAQIVESSLIPSTPPADHADG
jgi:hypothetical protein